MQHAPLRSFLNRLKPVLCASFFVLVAGPVFAQPVNVALSREVTADSYDGLAKSPPFAVDGVSAATGERWVSDDSGPHWIQIELGNSYVLSQLKFWSGGGSSYGFQVTEYQLQTWDGWNWIDLLTVTGDANGGQADQSFTPALSGERIRLYSATGDSGNRMRLYEVEVYGEAHGLNLMSRTPEPNEIITRTDLPIEITFNRDISMIDAGLLRVRDPATNASIGSFTPSISGATLTLTPSPELPWGSEVEVVIPAGALEAATDPSLDNGTLIWSFNVAPEEPQSFEVPFETTDFISAIDWMFDRPLALLDASGISLFDVTAGSLVAGTTATVSGDTLSLSHPGLAAEHIYRVEVATGSIAGSLGGSANDRMVAGLYAGQITLLDSRFTNNTEGWATVGRWEWDPGALSADFGHMRSGSSQPSQYAYSPTINLEGAKTYQINLFTSTTANSIMAGLAAAPFSLDLNDPAYEEAPDWTEIGRWPWVGTRKESFSPPADGDYHVLVTNIDVENTAHTSSFDNVRVNLAVPPEILVDLPAYDSSFTEGTVIDLDFDVLPFAGDITSVTVYDPLDERTVASFNSHQPEGYSVNWSYITTPGTRELEITAVDSTGLSTTRLHRVTVTLTDGSLPQLIHWDFDSDLEGWSGPISRYGNSNGPGSEGIRPGQQPPWFASPEVFLFAGETYRISFDHIAYKSGSNYIWGFLPYPAATYPSGETPLEQFLVDQMAWTNSGVEFTVPADGSYHLVFWEINKSVSQTDIEFDNFRLEGVLNSAPSVTLTAPQPGIRSVVGGTVTLSADASDLDGSVTEVRFMRNTRILFTDTTPPYTYDWVLPSEGELSVHAVAYDNSDGFSATDPVTITVEKNRLDLSTYLGNASDDESVRQVAYQSDNTLVVAGILDPEVLTGIFPSVTPVYLNGASAGDRGVVARFTETGDNLLSLAVVGEVAVDMSLDDADNIHVAAGPDGTLKLNPGGDTLLWSHSLASTRAHRIDTGPSGTTAVIYSSQSDYDDKQLSGAQVALIDNAGTQLNILGGAGTFTTDVCIDEASQTVVLVGFKNFNTDSNPVDVPVMYGRDYSNNRVWRAYDWGQNPGTAPNPAAFSDGGSTFAAAYPSWDPLYESVPPLIDTTNPAPPTVADLQVLGADTTLNSYTDEGGQGYLDAYAEWRDDWDRWLNRPTNNMADSRGARVTIGEDGYLYAGFEFDGGNTPLRYDPFSLNQQVAIVGGDQYNFMANTSTVPKVFVGRYLADTGAYQLGQWTTARLNSGGDNTLRLDRGDLYADHLGRVHIVGEAFANIDLSIDHFPGGYRGGAYYLVLSPDFKNRELWVRFNTSGFTRGVAVAPSGRIALGGDTDSAQFPTNAWQVSLASASDAFLVVGDFVPYFSFQIGEHPRLFFGPEDVLDLQEKLGEEPFQSMYQSLLFQRTIGAFADDYDPNAIYDVALRAQINGFLYVLTEDETYAIEAKTLVQEVFDNTESPWADSGTKGLALYWLATRVALAYDWCVNSDAWDEAFSYTVSAELLNAAEVIINSGGTEQNTADGSNWQGARGAAGGLALLATDHVYGSALADSAWGRVDDYMDEAYDGSGWLSEGTGYFYFPVGNYVGPYGIALARQNPARDLRDYPAFRNAFWSAMVGNVANTRPFGWPGVKPDWSDDGPSIGGEGVYGLGFYFAPDSIAQPYKHAYEATQGTDSPYYSAGVHDNGLWDGYRGGTIWSYLYYPVDTIATDPTESYDWHALQSDPNGNGIFTWRDQYLDGSDILAQFKARLSLVNGHDAPDGLGFRIIAGESPFVVGGGRNSPGRNIGQTTVYPSDPDLGVSTNELLGELVGTPLVTPRGDGHIVARMNTNNVQTTNHKRWFVSSFDSARTGAEAAFLVADTTDNGQYWVLNTFAGNSISVVGNTFTITDDSGASMKGTVLYPTSGYTITSGTRERGSSFGYEGGVFVRDADPVLNPPIEDNGYVQVQSAGGDFLIALTVVGSGGTHPAVSQSSGTVADAVVDIGSLEIGLQAGDVLYDGVPYTFPDATVTFDPGAHGSIAGGSAVQVISYGGAAVAPTLNVDGGFIFNGWDKVYDPVLKDMTVTATYLAIEAIPSDPDRLDAEAVSAVEIALTWRDNSIGETGFVLESSPDGTSWSVLDTLPPEAESYSHSGLAPDTLVYYRVKATGAGGDSGWSNTASATTLPPNTPPSFDSTPGLQAHEGIAYFDTIIASDPEEDTLAITAVVLPGWLQLIDFGDGSADLVGTPDATETGDHLVTLAVSDGINAPVETSFTINVNAKPVVTLVSPTMTPVLLPSGVGIEVEVSVTDETASDVTWSLVDGDGSLTFDAATGLVNGVTASTDGIYTIRATASDGVLSGSTDLLVEWGAAAVQLTPTTIIDFGYDDLVTDEFRGAGESRTTGLDWDADGPDDSAYYYDFREDIPFSAGSFASPNDRNFYGGMVVRVIGTDTFTVNGGASSDTPFDKVGMRFGNGGDGISKSVTAVWFWDKADFRNGADSAPVRFGEGSELNIPTLFDVFSGARWVVRSGSQYYVSQTALGNNELAAQLESDEIAAELWAEYNPVPGTYDIDFDAATAVFDTPSSALTDITAVGFIWDNDFRTGRFWKSWTTFRAIATVDAPVNRGPVVDAGGDETTETGVAVSLSGSATDEGLPEVPGSVSVQWTVRSGPGGSFGTPNAPATDYTPAAEGAHVLRLTADDGSIRTFDEVTVTASSGDAFSAWIDGYPAIPVDRRGPGDDWIGDGIPHVIKFAFNLDPTVNHSATSLITVAMNGTRLALIVDMAAQRSDVLYEVEVADDPDGPWTVIASASGGVPMAPAAGIEPPPPVQYDGTVVTVSDYLLISETADGRRFGRLTITYPSP